MGHKERTSLVFPFLWIYDSHVDSIFPRLRLMGHKDWSSLVFKISPSFSEISLAVFYLLHLDLGGVKVMKTL